MTKFSKETLRQLFSLPIEQVAAHYFNLENQGKDKLATHCNHVGGDKTPSLFFYKETNSFYCFGCQAGSKKTGGSTVVHFIMWQEQLTFEEACLFLAKKFNIDIVYDDRVHLTPDQKNKMLSINQASKRLYSDQKALIYLARDRGFASKKILQRFQLGLTDIDGDYSRRHRISFPIFDDEGLPVGFNERSIYDDDPKYLLDCPNKSHYLYGFHLIKNWIKEKNYLLLVEGVFDVMRAQSVGLPAAGLLGSSVSSKQIETIKKQTSTVILWLDNDTAGQEASILIGEKLLQEGLDVYLFSCDFEEKDPDLIIRHNRKDDWPSFFEDHLLEFFTFKTERLFTQYFSSVYKEKQKLISLLKEELELIPTGPQRIQRKKELSNRLDLHQEDW